MQLFIESSNSSLIGYNLVHFRISFTVPLLSEHFCNRKKPKKLRSKKKPPGDLSVSTKFTVSQVAVCEEGMPPPSPGLLQSDLIG